MYQVVVIDPPWPKKKGGIRSTHPNQTRELDYNTMSVGEIGDFIKERVLPLLEKPGCMFLWTIEEFLWEASELLNCWGYKLHTRLIWDKQNGVAPARTVRYTHEYVLWGYTSPMLSVAKQSQGKFTTVFQGQRREHSRKPDSFYEMVGFWYPTQTKIDVFSREKRIGWDQLGNQTDYFNA